jgi:hypothetical protein
MATGFICSTFDIVILGAADLNVTKLFTASRSFTIVGISAINLAAAADTLLIVNTTAGAAITGTTAAPPVAGTADIQAQAQVGPTAPVTLFAANAAVTKGDIISVVTGAATVGRVTLSCVGNPSEAVVVT